MGRAPCCEKMGMKKGPWTPEEDQVLVSYVQRFGHGNWRALPKQAGLLRCGKSCRLRWMNYLRPDIKRGNFTKDEEEMIIKLHQMLGNRWSAIAEKLPGRTDNEIKNVWHTHLKKRLHPKSNNNTSPLMHYSNDHECRVTEAEYQAKFVDVSKKEPKLEKGSDLPVSPQYSAVIDASTATTTAVTTTTTTITKVALDNYYVPELPSEDFWTQVLSSNNVTFSMPTESGFELDLVSPVNRVPEYEVANAQGVGIGDERDFWCNLMSRMGEFPELLEM